MATPMQKIAGIQKTYRHATRYSEIIGVLFKYGFGDLVEALNIQKYVLIAMPTAWRDEWEKRSNLPLARRVRLALEELGPTFVKLGQILSSHPELVPADVIQELQHLQENVRPFAFEDVKRILAEELGPDWEAGIKSLEETPIGSASIGQVHKAALADGEVAVVKVQRPGIQRVISVDLEIMLHLATLLEREGYASWHPTDMVEELGRVISRETDYTVEAGQQERFATNFQSDPKVSIPGIHRKLSTSRVLTMEYVEGVRPRSAEALAEAGLDPKEVARHGFDVLLRQIFEHGFFHADPHPGNLRILPGNVLCFLDFGMVGRMSQEERNNFMDLVVAIAGRDAHECTRAFLRLASYDNVPDREALERSIDEMLTRHLKESLSDLDLGALLEGILAVVAEHRMRIPEDLMMMVKSLSMIEGVGRSLDPDFDPLSQAGPFLRQHQMKRLSPDRLAREWTKRVQDLSGFLAEIPDELRELSRQLRKGELQVGVDHSGLEPIAKTMDRSSRRMALAILVGALLISSSVMELAGVKNVGFLGFFAAGVVSIWLIVSLLRQGWK